MKDLLSDLNEAQRQAVTHIDGPLLVLAGAGSGKTRVITRRIAYIVSQGRAPWSILGLTFTNKAAGEMRARVESLGVARGVTLTTFHALCARLLREFAAEAGLNPNYTIYDRDDQLKVIKQVIAESNIIAGSMTPGSVHTAVSRLKNQYATTSLAASEARTEHQRVVARFYQHYERLLAANNALDFDDLLLRMAGLLKREDICELLSRRYQYVLIDEYQDTNRVQFVIANAIARHHGNICVTGDPDQSIYGWRGADIKNIMEFETHYPAARVVRLEENYRSTMPILAAAGKLIEHNVQRKRKALWTRRPGGSPVHILLCNDEHTEAAEVARRVQALAAGGEALGEVAVFFRTNFLSRIIEQAMFSAQIPYRVARGIEFYNRKEIKDVLAYLKLMVNPSDDLSFLRVVNTPTRGIGSSTVDRLAEFAATRRVPLLEACKEASSAGMSAAAARKLEGFAGLIASLASNIARPVQAIMEDVIQRTGIAEAMSGNGEEEANQAEGNIDELITAAAQFDQQVKDAQEAAVAEEANVAQPPSAVTGTTLADYLHGVSLVSDVDHFEGGSGAVSLMTMHAAKGLEFRHVFIIGCEQGLLPFQRQDAGENPGHDPVKHMEEERRLAFVGITRAKDVLTLSCARTRMLRGKNQSQAASPFIGEIGEQDVVREDLRTRAPAAPRPAMARGGFFQDAEDRAVIEAQQDTEHFPEEYEGLAPGSIVEHAMFGRGKVIRLSQPWPQTRAEIHFQNVGPKTIVLRVVKLRVLSGGE